MHLRSLALALAILPMVGQIPNVGSIKVTIVDNNGHPLTHARIRALSAGTAMDSLSDSEGVSVFKDLAAGHWTIACRVEGYGPVSHGTIGADVVPGATIELKVTMRPAQVVVCPTELPLWPRFEHAGPVTTITSDDWAHLPLR